MKLHIFPIFFRKMSVHDEAAHIGEVDHLERGVLVHLAGIGDDVALPGGGDHGLVAGDFLEVWVADAFAQIDGGNAAETFVNGEGADEIRCLGTDDGTGFGTEFAAGDVDVHAVQK